jgi:hypothetical protein
MWFWLISSIAGSIIGSATEGWFRDTKVGVWFYAKIDSLYTWASNRYGLKILTDEEETMKKFPQLIREQLEIDEGIKHETYLGHLGYPTFGIGHLDKRLLTLEKKIEELENGPRPK